MLPAYSQPEIVASSSMGNNLIDAFVKEGFYMFFYPPIPTRGVPDDLRKIYQREKKDEIIENGHLIFHRFNMFREGKNPVFRAIRYFLCAVKQFNRGVFAKDARKCDVLFVASTPPIQGAMAAMVKKCRRNLKFVYNLQDIFPDSLIGAGLAKKGGFLWKIGRRIENFTYRNADKIIVISEDFKKNIMAKGVPEEKIEVVYNWVDADAVKPIVKADNPLYEEFGFNREKFTVVYAGNLGNAQNISIILDAASLLPEVQFAVFGSGGLEEDVRKRVLKDSLMNVHLNPLQPIERVSQVYSLGDVCVVSCKAGLGGSAMPSKTWTIMSCGRPVVASFDEGELKEIMEKYSCGVFSHSGNVHEFVEKIKMLEDNPELRMEMGKNARRFIEENLTKEVGTRKYIDVIKSVVLQ